MRPFVSRCILGLAIIAAVAVPAGAQPDEENFPRVEEYIARKDKAGFGRAVKQYLAEHPASPYVPRVLLDAYMIARVENDKNASRQLIEVLALQFPATTQGQFVIATQFKDADEFAKFIEKAIDDRVETISKSMARGMLAGIIVARRYHGVDVLKRESLLLKMAVLARFVGEKKLLAELKEKVDASEDETLKRLAKTCCDERADPYTSATQLALYPQPRLARRLYRFYFNQLEPDTLADEDLGPSLKFNYVRSLMIDRRFEDAEVHITGLMKKGVPDRDRSRYYHAWMQISNGRYDDALASLETMIADHPDSPWAAPAKQLIQPLREVDANLRRQIARMTAVADVIRQEAEQFEVLVESENDDKEEVLVYVALRPGQLLEFQYSRAGAMVMGLRISDKDGRYFVKGEGVHVYPAANVLPLPEVQLGEETDGTLTFSYAMRLGSSDEAINSIKQLRSSVWLTEAGVRRLIEYLPKRGYGIPTKIEKSPRGDVLPWIRPDFLEPQLSTLSFTVSAENRITRVNAGDSAAKRVRYGLDGAFEFDPPAWPEDRIIKHDKPDPTFFFRLLADLSRLAADTKDDPSKTKP